MVTNLLAKRRSNKSTEPTWLCSLAGARLGWRRHVGGAVRGARRARGFTFATLGDWSAISIRSSDARKKPRRDDLGI